MVTIDGVEGAGDGYALVDVGLSYALGENVGLNGDVHNLPDKELERRSTRPWASGGVTGPA